MMKKFYQTIFTVLMWALSNSSFGQSSCPIDNVITDSWDWRSTSYQFFLNGSNYALTNGLFEMESPWFGQYQNNNNINKFRNQNPKDFEPEDGWVLVQRDFGEPSRLVNHPYFILYNKYSSIIRIFVAISTTIGQNNSALINLTYGQSSKRSAVLELLSPDNFVNALTTFNNDIPVATVANDYSYNLPYWLHADFIANYDPCACNYSSQLFFDVKLVSNSTLSFNVNGNLVQNMDNLGRMGSGKQSFSGVVNDVQTLVDAGASFHSSSKSGLDMLQEIFPSINYAENAAYNIIPGLGAAVGIVSKLSGAFTGKPNESEPLMFDANMKANGNITWEGSHRQILLDNPGAQLIPPTPINYRNALGVFNLLEAPKIQVAITLPNAGYASFPYSRTFDVKLAEDLKYVVNAAAGFDLNKSTFNAAFVFETSAFNFGPYQGGSNLNFINDSTLISNFMPFGNLTSYRARATIPTNYSYQVIAQPEVFLKIEAILRKVDSNGLLHETLFVAKYKTNIIEVTNVTEPDYLDYVQGTYSWAPHGTFSVTQTVYASQFHEMWGVYQVTNNAEVIFLSDNLIKIRPGSTIKPGFTLKIAAAVGERSIYQTPASSFCQDVNYNSRVTEFYARKKTPPGQELDDMKLKSLWSVYPNPTKNTVVVSLNETEDEAILIVVSDIIGNIVKRIEKKGKEGRTETIISLIDFPSGAYFVTIVLGQSKKTEKIILVK